MTSPSVHLKAFEAASDSLMEKCKVFVARGADINMALMGASPQNAPRTDIQKQICHWALTNGACFVFSFHQ